MASYSAPRPNLNGPFQPGITDPQWQNNPPEHITEQNDIERYRLFRAGRIDPQDFVTVITADVSANTSMELENMLKSFTNFADAEMKALPNEEHISILEEIPKTYRATITIGFGSKLFLSHAGDDRFGLRHRKPKWLRVMPKVAGDAFDPHKTDTDLIFIIASDHPYVNAHIARALCQGTWNNNKQNERLLIRTVDQGFARPDRREWLRFDDGIDNLSNANSFVTGNACPFHSKSGARKSADEKCIHEFTNRHERELDKLVYVSEQDREPKWTHNGSYMVWRKIEENLPLWESFPIPQQEQMIGRKRKTGQPVSGHVTGPSGMTPVFPDPRDASDGLLNSHIRKVQPRRSAQDLFGIPDLDRRFLRRGYPYFQEKEGSRKIATGLLFMAFMRNLREQFEWPVQSWQTNPDFPKPGAGIDIMYESGVFTNVSGGYYFCPPVDGSGFLGATLF